MPPSLDKPLLTTLQYHAPPPTVEPTTYLSLNEFKKDDPTLYAQYVELTKALGYQSSDPRDLPLPQELHGWPEIFRIPRETAANTALGRLKAGHEKTLTQDLTMRPFAEGSSKKPFRPRDDPQFTLHRPKIERLDETSVTFAPDLIKMGLVSAFSHHPPRTFTLTNFTDCHRLVSSPFAHSLSRSVNPREVCKGREGREGPEGKGLSCSGP